MKVTFLLGSKSDQEFAEKIAATLDEFGVPHEMIVASAHKVPEKVVEIMDKLNTDPQPQVIITVVGMSNGLAGVAAASLVHPVVNCPPYKTIEEYSADIHSNLRYPSEVPAMTVLTQKNAALAAVKILAVGNEKLKAKVKARIEKMKSQY
ncbi:MAG TPA: AIR carboxylase family protein [Candidatus Peribacteraceae bacterium]|nr:AIR carboxylase family protein [Candidatus Peribacteraceae bacterium]